MGHLTVKIKYKKATNESTINVEQGNLAPEEYARAITAINDYLVACVKEHAAKLRASVKEATGRFTLPTSFTPIYEFPPVLSGHHDITNDLFRIFASPSMSDIGISISTQHEMQLLSDSVEPGKPVLLRSPRHGLSMSMHPSDAMESGLDDEYEITKSRLTITVTQGGKAVMIQFPKLLPPARPFSETRGQLLLKVLFQHLAKYKPVMCDLDQIEDVQTHVIECRSGKVTLSEPILPADFKRIITNLTQLVDAEDEKINARNKARGTQERKRATVDSPPGIGVAEIMATTNEAQQSGSKPKRSSWLLCC